MTSRLLPPALIIAATLVAFWPLVDNDFVNWGDHADIVDNGGFRGFTPEHLQWMLTTIRTGHYQPLSWLSLALDYQVWGMNPHGYHLTSVLLHVACAVVVYLLALRLLAIAEPSRAVADSRALILSAVAGALLFALHPLRVEAVAWATERRGPLSALFFLLSILCYVDYARSGNDRRLQLSLLLFGLSLLSKEFGVTLPVVLLVLDIYPLRRLGGGPGRWFGPGVQRIWREKIPFFALSLAGAAVAMVAALSVGARSIGDYGPAQRLAQSAYGLAFYVWKTFVPTKLSNLYQIPQEMNPWDGRFLASATVVLLITGIVLALRKRFPAALAVWICYGVVLSPVLGLVQTGPQIAADRYTYLPAVGLSLVGAGLLWRLVCARPAGRVIALASVPVVLVLLGASTRQQADTWQNSETLWRHALAVDPASPMAHTNLGVVLAETDRLDEAVQAFTTAIALDPAEAEAHNGMGVVSAMRGRLDEAEAHWREALRLNPRHPSAGRNLARALRLQAVGAAEP